MRNAGSRASDRGSQAAQVTGGSPRTIAIPPAPRPHTRASRWVVSRSRSCSAGCNTFELAPRASGCRRTLSERQPGGGRERDPPRAHRERASAGWRGSRRLTRVRPTPTSFDIEARTMKIEAVLAVAVSCSILAAGALADQLPTQEGVAAAAQARVLALRRPQLPDARLCGATRTCTPPSRWTPAPCAGSGRRTPTASRAARRSPPRTGCAPSCRGRSTSW